MIKWLIMILILPVCMAGIDFTTKPGLTGDEQIMSVTNPTAANSTQIDRGFIHLPVSGAVTPGGGSEGYPHGQVPIKQSQRAVSLYYDVIVDVLKDKYTPQEFIHARLIIINKGHFPDRDGELYSYLLDPYENKWREWNQTFELIPPTCPIGRYNPYSDVCVYEDYEYPPEKTLLYRNMTLPQNASLGEWSFYIEYETHIQPKITSYDTFEVVTRVRNVWVIIAFLLFLLFYYYREKSRKKSEEGESRWRRYR